MPGADRRRQKKLEATRKKRALIKKDARKREAQFQGASLLRIAQTAPFGPAWVSASLDDEGDGPPTLINVVVTRRVRGLLLAQIALVDRTCLGVKNAMLLPLLGEDELLERLHRLHDELRVCEPLEAQSVVFHALDYARSLGFFAHEDFESALFEPRPDALLATPRATPARPIYITGPDDDFAMILARLEEHVGRGNYDLLAGGIALDDLTTEFGALGAGDDGDGDDDDDERDEIETTGESLVDSPE